MSLSKLEPGRDYDGEEFSNYYHGLNAYQLDGVLERGSVISNQRRTSDDYGLMVAHLHEDIIRDAGEDITDISLADGDEVMDYVRDNRESLVEDGSEYTQWLLEEEDIHLDEGLGFVDSLVWVSKDRQEARNYCAERDLPGCGRGGGCFRFSLPESSVLEMGLNGGVPGEIPLKFADTLYLEEMEQEEKEDVWLGFIESEYDVDILEAR